MAFHLLKKGNRWFLLFLLLLAACGGGDDTPQISQTILANEESATKSTSVFGPSDTIYLLVEMTGPADTRAKASWVAVNAENTDANYLIDDAELPLNGAAQLVFDLSNTGPWPTGDYKVDLLINDEIAQSFPFRIQLPLAQAADTGSEPAVAEPAPEEAPVVTGGPVTTLEGVKSATIQIEAQGSFVDPQVGLMLNAAGRGSGLIIDPSGIAVTNNHVVTGAAFIQVWIGGEPEPHNARILGVSECSDLALIDIDGEGYPYLQWYEDDIAVGLDVYAAGYPLGDPEFTLTRGIVSKARASGETNWASVDAVLEHDATINPGNSGGPLVDANGRIVGINYAGSNEVSQYFAIVGQAARPLIEQLRAEQDVHSIGVNGQAVSDNQGLTGIWVSSVKSGSQADIAGVNAGDIITTLEGLVLATDGTMADYCDILRTHNPSDTMNLEVLRFDTQEVLAGQLNGRELAITYSFAQNLEEAAADDSSVGGSADAAGYASYQTINDDTGTLTVEVPTAWSDVNGGAWIIDEQVVGQQVAAAPDLDGFYNTWTTSGVVFAVSADLADVYTESELLDEIVFTDSCNYDGRQPYSDALYTGSYDIWSGCGGGDILFIVLAAKPETGHQVLLVQVQVVSDADLEALDHILASFVADS